MPPDAGIAFVVVTHQHAGHLSLMADLLANARDAMPKGGSLTIRTEEAHLDEEEAKLHHPLAERGSYVRLWVQDTGIGMDERTKAHILRRELGVSSVAFALEPQDDCSA